MTFSIVTATKNSLGTLTESYASLVAQTETDWQWIVVDGGSNDGTQDWLQSLNDQRLNWISEADNGIYDALNKGLKMAKSEIIGFLHSDDVYADSDVLAFIKIAMKDTEYDGIYGDLVYFNTDKNIPIRSWKSSPFRKNRAAWGWMLPHPTLYLKKEVYDLIGGFNTSYRIAADYEFMLRVFKERIPLKYIPKTLVAMRYGGISSNWRNQFRKSKEDARVLRNQGYRLVYFRVLLKTLRKLNQHKIN